MADLVARRPARPMAIARRPISTMFLPVAIVCFVGALITDIAYAQSGGTLIWVNFSSWLIAAGLVFGAIGAIVLLIDGVRGAVTWAPFGLLVLTWIVEFINSLIHARDGWTAVVPLGLILSIVASLLILIAGWLNRPVVEVVR
ncbi:DUF2231 domain-containing protein [Sphingomonas sp. URHD0057]|uniref:DUF2231 domain-containing protein n=1 Tax=Sphingomonas sp. URHD0057 TaxID=1380389 RepID=UPI00048F06A6|nr:DUF2231 domain-containing protein [Sphingomonas sp. URHD0057]